MYGHERRKFKKKLGSISGVKRKQNKNSSTNNKLSGNNAYDPYKVLGVTPDVLMNEIKKSYRFLAKAYHPDLNHDEREKVVNKKKYKKHRK